MPDKITANTANTVLSNTDPRNLWYSLADIYIIHSPIDPQAFPPPIPIPIPRTKSHLVSVVLVVTKMEIVVLSITQTKKEDDGVDER